MISIMKHKTEAHTEASKKEMVKLCLVIYILAKVN